MARKKQENSPSPEATESSAEIEETVETLKKPLPPYSTQDFDTAEFLNLNGVHPVSCSGTPMTFEYSPFESHKIEKLLLERMGGKT